uniref:Skp1_POZ domain-containing protein n=1 Tax=Panagrellus redivivus TaxID=6233 RepID=A0A7E4W9E6_PANRE
MAAIVANLPETFKIRTVDDQVLEVTGKLINESAVIKQIYESKKDSNDTEITVPVNYSDLKTAMNVLELCDLNTPHVLHGYSDRLLFVEANQPAMECMSLWDEDFMATVHLAGSLEITHLTDLCIAIFLEKIKGKSVTEARQICGYEYGEEEESAVRRNH